LPTPTISFIPNEEFQSASEQDFSEIDVQLYREEEERPNADPSEAFLSVIAQSRLLTIEGERHLFKRLNFLRFRANALQATMKGKRKNRKTQKEIDRLLDTANEVREQIARACLRLATSIVRKHSSSRDEFDEFLAEANAILLNAIDKFDYARGYRFSTYATHAIQRHTFRLIEKRNKRRQREVSGNDLALDTVQAEPTQSGSCEAELFDAMKQIVANIETALEDREQTIVRMRFGLDGSSKGKSLRVIGDELGLSKERVRQLLQQSIEKLAESAKQLEATLEF
jgi:RNA polymerase primary sigma factor